MADFFTLSAAERLEALNAATNLSGRLPHLLEKDIWVVWSLRHLFTGPHADHLVFNGGTSPMLAFPVATPQVMRAERTFREKATAIHVFCAQGAFRGGERFARHWHDIARLDTAGFVDTAVADTALGAAVADHKSIFFAENYRAAA